MLFFLKDTATTDIYTLSLHDALPILVEVELRALVLHLDQAPERGVEAGRLAAAEELEHALEGVGIAETVDAGDRDRKSTRLNSSHSQISYAVFCLKKKIKQKTKIVE